MKKIFKFIGILCIFAFLQANEIDTLIESQLVQKQFLIVKSTKSYQEAKAFAKKISKQTGIPLNLQNLSYDKENLLTLPKDVCEDNGFEFPCYWARGRYDDGVYVSIEHSSAYEEFRNGYYIVMVASGENVKGILKKVKKVVKDAYIKTSKIYMGCVH